ncbi:MAG: OmpH family outer membrane protein [Candidatus Aminicenantes bacterium]|jgi:outer membrane protein|nr:OmpH family outer membrane protein [Candidatus Aminicenantes bacterium]
MTKNRKKVIPPALLLTVFFLLTALTVRAQNPTRVAIINSQKAFDQSAEGKKAVAILQEKEDQIKAELKKRNEEIQTLKDKLTGQKLTLSQEALNQLQQEIDRQEAARKKYEQDSSQEFEQFKSQLIKKIRDEMLAIVDDLVKERGYDLVFDLSTSGLVHYNPALDITDEVIKRYDASKKQTAGK